MKVVLMGSVNSAMTVRGNLWLGVSHSETTLRFPGFMHTLNGILG